jgi:hypothetical protein
MESIAWPILSVRDAAPKEFVLFWERLYSGYDEAFYQDNIHQPLTEDRIHKWFIWKNGTPLSIRKIESIRRYLDDEQRIGNDVDDTQLKAFLNKPGGAIWRIFWLHLQHPQVFPIYDQHVHRAMAYLLGLPKREIPVHNPSKVRSYVEEYRPFVRRFAECENRMVDRALWTFGRFLSSGYAPMLAIPGTSSS